MFNDTRIAEVRLIRVERELPGGDDVLAGSMTYDGRQIFLPPRRVTAYLDPAGVEVVRHDPTKDMTILDQLALLSRQNAELDERLRATNRALESHERGEKMERANADKARKDRNVQVARIQLAFREIKRSKVSATKKVAAISRALRATEDELTAEKLL